MDLQQGPKTAIVFRNTEENNGDGYIIGVFRSELKFRKYLQHNYAKFFKTPVANMPFDEIKKTLSGWCHSAEKGPLL